MIQIDSREHQKVIDGIKKAFDAAGEKWFVSKLYVGDYMNYDNPRLVVDRKQNLSELCGNVCQQHERFRAEIIRANEAGIKLVFLCEHGKGIEKLDDVLWWENPRAKKRVKRMTSGWNRSRKLYMEMSYIRFFARCNASMVLNFCSVTRKTLAKEFWRFC